MSVKNTIYEIFNFSIYSKLWAGLMHSPLGDTNEIYDDWRFLRAKAAARLSHRNSVRLSVRLSHGWISQKRCKLGLPNFYRRLPGRLYRVFQKTDTQFYFWDNFGNLAPILTILSLLQAEIYDA